MRSMMGRFVVATPILAAGLCFAAPVRADVKAGAQAWARGDYAAAVDEWRGPAAQGDAEAQYDLAQAYKFGKGVAQDLAKAEELFGKAAANGHVQAADNYGLLRFQRGDRIGALPYIQAAAERGDARAQYLLGIACFNGDVVPKDWVRAYALLLLARQAGLPQASSAIVQMDSHIPLEQRQQAAVLAPRIAAGTETSLPSRPATVDLVARAPEADVTRLAEPKPAPAASLPPGHWRVQLGAFGVRANADTMWDKVKDRPEITGRPRIDAGTGNVKRLLAGGFNSETEATAACSRLSAAGIACIVTRN